jgi:protein-disulfide isomerase
MAPPSRVAPRQPESGASSNRFFLILGALAVAGAAVLAVLVLKPKDESIPAKVTVLAADTAGFRGYLVGSPTAPLEVTEYADFQCPACGSFDVMQWDVVKRQLVDSGLVRWRYRDFPLDQVHRHARVAAHSAACANDQGKFWEFKALVYQRQGDWSIKSSAGGMFHDMAKEAGLDPAKFDACMDSKKYAGRIEASLQEGIKLGVPSTPTFFIDGRLYPGAFSSDSLAALVRSIAARQASAKQPK